MLKVQKKAIVLFSVKYFFALAASYLFLEIVVYRKTAFSKDFFSTMPFVVILYVGGILIASFASGWITFAPSEGADLDEQGD